MLDAVQYICQETAYWKHTQKLHVFNVIEVMTVSKLPKKIVCFHKSIFSNVIHKQNSTLSTELTNRGSVLLQIVRCSCIWIIYLFDLYILSYLLACQFNKYDTKPWQLVGGEENRSLTKQLHESQNILKPSLYKVKVRSEGDGFIVIQPFTPLKS